MIDHWRRRMSLGPARPAASVGRRSLRTVVRALSGPISIATAALLRSIGTFDSPRNRGGHRLSSMTANLGIGEFSRATCLGVKTLRQCQEVGLLEPACIDLSGGYPYYRPDQIATVRIIRRLRDLEMPVERVKGALDAPDLRARQPLIAAHLKHMQEQLEFTAGAALALRTLLEEPEGAEAISYRTAPQVDRSYGMLGRHFARAHPSRLHAGPRVLPRRSRAHRQRTAVADRDRVADPTHTIRAFRTSRKESP